MFLCEHNRKRMTLLVSVTSRGVTQGACFTDELLNMKYSSYGNITHGVETRPSSFYMHQSHKLSEE